jgi:hypothetical protein
MTFTDLFNDTCTIQKRTVTQGKTVTEAWTDQVPTICRALFQAISSRNLEKTQYATTIRVRFCLPSTASISIRDRIKHAGRIYEVIHVTPTIDGEGSVFHKVAVCEGIAGNV